MIVPQFAAPDTSILSAFSGALQGALPQTPRSFWNPIVRDIKSDDSIDRLSCRFPITRSQRMWPRAAHASEKVRIKGCNQF